MLMLACSRPSARRCSPTWRGARSSRALLEIKPPPSMFREGGSWLALARLVGHAAHPRDRALLRVPRHPHAHRGLGHPDALRRHRGPGRGRAGRGRGARRGEGRAAPRERRGEREPRPHALLAVLSVARPAHAALDPSRAQADVDARHPRERLPVLQAPRARRSPPRRASCARTPARSPAARGSPRRARRRGAAVLAAEQRPAVVVALVEALALRPVLPGHGSRRCSCGSSSRRSSSPSSCPSCARIARMQARARRREEGRAARGAPGGRAGLGAAMLSDEELLLARADELAARRSTTRPPCSSTSPPACARSTSAAPCGIARDRTNGEYVRACADPAAKPALRDIVREVDRVQFGGEDATHDGRRRARRSGRWRSCARCRAMLLSPWRWCSCPAAGAAAARREAAARGDDPAGGELLRDVLTQAGRDGVRRSETSLASLPAARSRGSARPRSWSTLERTSLDDETRDAPRRVGRGGRRAGARRATRTRGRRRSGPRRRVHGRPVQAHRAPAARACRPGSRGATTTEAAEEQSAHLRADRRARGARLRGRRSTFSAAAERVASFDDGTTLRGRARARQGLRARHRVERAPHQRGPRPARQRGARWSPSSRAPTAPRCASPTRRTACRPPRRRSRALLRAGLGLGARPRARRSTLVLFLAVGVRLARPRPAPPPRRRAFAEHVEAVGALYARARKRSARARRLRALRRRAPARAHAARLGRRGRVPRVARAACRSTRASASGRARCRRRPGRPPLGDELAVLRELSAIYAAAMAQDKVKEAGARIGRAPHSSRRSIASSSRWPASSSASRSSSTGCSSPPWPRGTCSSRARRASARRSWRARSPS